MQYDLNLIEEMNQRQVQEREQVQKDIEEILSAQVRLFHGPFAHVKSTNSCAMIEQATLSITCCCC